MATQKILSFQFKEQTYTAFITVTGLDGARTVTIHVPDESLQTILGSSSITFNASKGLHVDYPAFTPAQQLLVCILAAIDKDEQKKKQTTGDISPF
jgi:hypothetical protein